MTRDVLRYSMKTCFLPNGGRGFLTGFFGELNLVNSILESNYLKMTPDDIQTAVENYTELSEFLSNTVFQPSLESDEFDIVDAIYSRKLDIPGLQADSIINDVRSIFRA